MRYGFASWVLHSPPFFIKVASTQTGQNLLFQSDCTHIVIQKKAHTNTCTCKKTDWWKRKKFDWITFLCLAAKTPTMIGLLLEQQGRAALVPHRCDPARTDFRLPYLHVSCSEKFCSATLEVLASICNTKNDLVPGRVPFPTPLKWKAVLNSCFSWSIQFTMSIKTVGKLLLDKPDEAVSNTKLTRGFQKFVSNNATKILARKIIKKRSSFRTDHKTEIRCERRISIPMKACLLCFPSLTLEHESHFSQGLLLKCCYSIKSNLHATVILLYLGLSPVGGRAGLPGNGDPLERGLTGWGDPRGRGKAKSGRGE